MKQRHVVVTGGGASGMVAAIAAARGGAKVTILEQKDRIGKKILSTGNGKCNLTNEVMSDTCFRGDDTSIVSEVFAQFGYPETVQFFEELGLLFKNRQGYLYPLSEQASAVLDILRMELSRLHVDILTDTKAMSAQKEGERFLIETNRGPISGDALILATGGKAAPVLGSDGSGYVLSKAFGHHLSQVVPALVQLRGKGDYFKQVAGVRTQANVTLYVDGEAVSESCGELQLTDYGISGIPVFQVSRYGAKALARKRDVWAELDFLPTMSEKAFMDFMQERKNAQGHKTAEEFCVGIFHKKLGGLLLKRAGIAHTIPMQEIKERQFQRFLTICKHFQVEITQTNSFAQAQVCAGGVKTTEINPRTMESLCCRNLYLTGELLDIDGICGGYNLQWAWSTGYIAGIHAAKGK